MLRRVLPGLFEAVLDVYVRWMAAGARQYDVPRRTVASLLKDHHVGAVQLLKVDVEGAEVEVRGLHACTGVCDWLFNAQRHYFRNMPRAPCMHAQEYVPPRRVNHDPRDSRNFSYYEYMLLNPNTIRALC